MTQRSLNLFFPIIKFFHLSLHNCHFIELPEKIGTSKDFPLSPYERGFISFRELAISGQLFFPKF